MATKFKFQMQGILNVKESIAEQKEQEFAKAIQALANERAILESLYNEKAQTVEELRGATGKKINPFDFKMLNNYVEYLKSKIISQNEVIKKAENFVEVKRGELIEATKEKKMLDKLKENKLEEHFEEEKQAEQKSVDEIVSFKYKQVMTQELIKEQKHG